MKIQVSEKKAKQLLPFPKLMVDVIGNIVLFLDKNIGTVIQPAGSGYKAWFNSTNWDMTDFVDFTGEITLSND